MLHSTLGLVCLLLQGLLKESQAASRPMFFRFSSPRPSGAGAATARGRSVSGSGDGGTGRSLVQTAKPAYMRDVLIMIIWVVGLMLAYFIFVLIIAAIFFDDDSLVSFVEGFF
jgi:F0F1-type ATP synthase membrane subunit c/vacuolar-type H+-ATPase subunit K